MYSNKEKSLESLFLAIAMTVTHNTIPLRPGALIERMSKEDRENLKLLKSDYLKNLRIK